MCFRCVGLKFEMAENGRKWPFHQRKTKILGIIRFSYPYRAADQCNTTQHPPYGSTHVPRVRTSRQGSSGHITRGMVEVRQVVVDLEANPNPNPNPNLILNPNPDPPVPSRKS